jgi:hypothetical protein
MNSTKKPAYLHTVHTAAGSTRRVWLGDAVLQFTIGNRCSCSRRTARLIAARERHKENVFQSRVRAAMAAGHSLFDAECIAAAHNSLPKVSAVSA